MSGAFAGDLFRMKCHEARPCHGVNHQRHYANVGRAEMRNHRHIMAMLQVSPEITAAHHHARWHAVSFTLLGNRHDVAVIYVPS